MKEEDLKKIEKSKESKDIKQKKKKQKNTGYNEVMKQRYFDYYSDIKSSARDNGEW